MWTVASTPAGQWFKFTGQTTDLLFCPRHLIKSFSLVKNPTYYEQPDLDGDGARDLDPIGKLGELVHNHIL